MKHVIPYVNFLSTTIKNHKRHGKKRLIFWPANVFIRLLRGEVKMGEIFFIVKNRRKEPLVKNERL